MNGSFGAEQSNKRILTIAFASLAVLLGAAGFFFWQQSQPSKANTPPADAATSAQRVIDKVATLYIVPSNEVPTVAELQDTAKLAGQEFYKGAKNGDYLLVYKEAALALIYRPSIAKLVTVGPISLDQQTVPETP